jgi:hypothetical protein
MGALLADLVRWVFDVVHSFGYVGVFVLILAGSLFMPVPTELTLPLIGSLVGHGCLSFFPVLITASAPWSRYPLALSACPCAGVSSVTPSSDARCGTAS